MPRHVLAARRLDLGLRNLCWWLTHYQLFQFRAMLEQKGYNNGLDTLNLVSSRSDHTVVALTVSSHSFDS